MYTLYSTSTSTNTECSLFAFRFVAFKAKMLNTSDAPIGYTCMCVQFRSVYVNWLGTQTHTGMGYT